MPSDTIILAFDTSAAHCAAVLLRDDHILAERHEEMGRAQVERLYPMLEALLEDAALTWSQLDAIAVCTGPGNFTGVRIGVSAARGLAMSLEIPAIGVSIFEAAAQRQSGEMSGLITVGVALPREQYAFQKFTAGMPPLAISGPEISETGYKGDYSTRDIAVFSGYLLASGNNIPAAKPVYLRPADAAPAKDRPPVILHDA